MAPVLKSIYPSLSPPNPPREISKTLDKLKKIKPYEAFNREFISAQIQDHEILRATQEQYLKAIKDLTTINTTKLVLNIIIEHLVLLSHLKRSGSL